MRAILFCLAGLILCWPLSAASDPHAVAAEVRRLETQLDQGGIVPALATLPAQWYISTPEGSFTISSKPLRDLIAAQAQNPRGESLQQAKAWLEHLAAHLDGSSVAPRSAANANQELARILSRREFEGIGPPTQWELLQNAHPQLAGKVFRTPLRIRGAVPDREQDFLLDLNRRRRASVPGLVIPQVGSRGVGVDEHPERRYSTHFKPVDSGSPRVFRTRRLPESHSMHVLGGHRPAGRARHASAKPAAHAPGIFGSGFYFTQWGAVPVCGAAGRSDYSTGALLVCRNDGHRARFFDLLVHVGGVWMPGGLEPSDRKLLLGAGAITLLLAAGTFALAPPARDQQSPVPSSYASGSGGALAAYLLLVNLHYDVQRWEEPPTQLGDRGSNAVLVLAEPSELPTEPGTPRTA